MPKPIRSKDRNIRRLTVVTQRVLGSFQEMHTAEVRDVLFGKENPVKELAEHPLDIMTLTPEKRTHPLAGPTLSVIADGNFVIRDNVPIRALMASSTKLHDLLHLEPKSTKFRIYRNVDRKSIERLLNIFTTPYIVEATDINLVGIHFAHDVLLYQACLALGIYHVHVKPLLDTLRAEISSRLLTIEERNTIVNRIPPTDPLFKHLANDLCHRRFRKEIHNIVGFEKWLGWPSRKKLQDAMVDIDQEHKKRREGSKEEGKEMLRDGLGKVTLPKKPGWNVVREDV